MGVVLKHAGVVRTTEKARVFRARMLRTLPGQPTEVIDRDIQVPMTLTGALTDDTVEVRSWFFKKALSHLSTDTEGFVYA